MLILTVKIRLSAHINIIFFPWKHSMSITSWTKTDYETCRVVKDNKSEERKHTIMYKMVYHKMKNKTYNTVESIPKTNLETV